MDAFAQRWNLLRLSWIGNEAADQRKTDMHLNAGGNK